MTAVVRPLDMTRAHAGFVPQYLSLRSTTSFSLLTHSTSL